MTRPDHSSLFPTDPALAARCIALAGDGGSGGTPVPVGIDGLTVVVARRPTSIRPVLNPPMVCLVLQGAKEIVHHDRGVRFAAGETAIVSHTLVARARIVGASPSAPYVAVACRLDEEVLRGLHAEVPPEAAAAARTEAVATGAADPAVAGVMGRLLDLVDRPLEQRVLLPMVLRELHFRVLLSRHGAMLRELVRTDSHASRIARAIGHIRRHWDTPLRAQELAEIAGMSPSSFHAHFKAVTATTPIQYQKSLRLIEARRRLTETGEPVSAIAFEVGYESATQFARDYRRAYGCAPSGARAATG